MRALLTTPRQHSRVTPGGKRPVVFIHGLWLHASSWQPWIRRFNAAGYKASAPGWPDFPNTVAETREHPDFMYDQSINQVADHYAAIVKKLSIRPVVIGHSFGGLMAQKLLDRKLVAAAVAIDPAPIKGVLRVPFAQLRSSWPVLGKPFRMHKAVSLKPEQFRYAFANKLSEAEAVELYERWTIPAPSKPLWQAATAAFNLHAQTKVDTHEHRQPLLLMAGSDDHTVPPQTTQTVYRLYEDSPSVTDFKVWPTRGHSLVIDHGWRELADYTLEWLRTQRMG